MRRVAVFCDAGYFWVQVCSIVLGARSPRTDVNLDYNRLRTTLLNEVAAQLPAADLLRVYWYDGPGPQGKAPDHVAIEKLDDFKLRLGTRNGHGQQKAVDGLIIADMVSLTQSKAITEALLISGDADITPGVVAAQAMGLRVHLLSIGPAAATSPYLSAEADRKTTWGISQVKGFATKKVAPAAPASPAAAQPSGAASATPAPATQPAPATTPNASNVGSAHQPSTSASGSGTSSSLAPSPAAALDCLAAAQSAYASMQSGTLASTVATLTSAAATLPASVDKRLLVAGRQQAGRTLSESEKRTLRVEFKKLLPSVVS